MTIPTETPKPALFDMWRAANPHSPFINAASEVHSALDAAIAIGRSLLPDSKFTTTNAIELARLVLDVSVDDSAAQPNNGVSNPYGGST